MSELCNFRIIHQRRLLEISLGLAVILTAGCSRSPQEKYSQFIKTGDQQFAAKDYNRAIIDYRNALQAQPDKADGHYLLALAYLAADRLPEGINELRRATELDPGHSKAQLKLAQLMIRTRDRDIVSEAAQRVQTVLAGNPSDLDALYEFAAAEAQLGRPEQAEKLLNQILEQSPADLKSILGLAQMKVSKKDFDGAIKILKEFTQQSPDSSDAEIALGAVYAATGNLAEAEIRVRAALRSNSSNASGLTLLALTQMQAGKIREAEETYQRLSQLSQPKYKTAYADFLSRQNRMSDAVQELERIWRADPNNVEARSRLVTGYAVLNRREAAQQILDNALQKNPKDIEALLQRSLISLDQGRYTEAENDVNQIYRSDPGSVRARYVASRIDVARGDLIKAKAELSKVLETTPGSLLARLDLARVLLDTNNSEEAQQTLNGAPSNQKQMAAFVVTQAWVWIGQGNRADARKAVDAVLAASRIPEALIQDGILKIANRDLAGARAPLEEALRGNPEDLRALGALAQTFPRGQEESAAEKIRSSIRQKPGSFPLQMFWAQWLLEHGKRPEAKSALLAAKVADPKQIASDVILARMDMDAGNLQAAGERLRPLVASGTSNFEAHLLLAEIEDATNNFSSAIDLYTRVLAVNSRNVVALNNLAFDLSRDDTRLDEALKHAQKAKELAPDDSHALDTLGWIYFRKGLYQLAVKELNLALAAGSRPTIQFHLGMTYKRLGDSRKGDQLVASAITAQPDLIKTIPLP